VSARYLGRPHIILGRIISIGKRGRLGGSDRSGVCRLGIIRRSFFYGIN
jgi:hypothetical protein